MGSGACSHVINQQDLPPGAVAANSPPVEVSHDANNSPIRRYGGDVTGGGGFPGPGGGGFPGPGGGGLPGQAPAEPVHFARDPELKFDRMFEDKVALNSLYAYTGKEGEKWMKLTRGYWMSRLPGNQGILDWAESLEGNEITDAVVSSTVHIEGGSIHMTYLDIVELGRAVWGFLNHCVGGAARERFDGSDQLNGLDAWRGLSHDIRKSHKVRKEQLRQLIKHVPAIKALEDVPSAIMAYDSRIKQYELVVGNCSGVFSYLRATPSSRIISRPQPLTCYSSAANSLRTSMS